MNVVVDANALSFQFIPNPSFTPSIEQLVDHPDVIFHAPRFWKSEMRSLFMKYVRYEGDDVPGGSLTRSDATEHMRDADVLVSREHEVQSGAVFQLTDESGCSTYDCEYVRLAQVMDTRLVTWDQEVLDVFPATAITPEDLAARLESSERDE